MFATHFLLRPPRWEYVLDVPEKGVHVRSLLNASAVLAASAPKNEFRLQDVLTYEIEVRVGNIPAQNLLLLHALSSLLLEGLIPRNPAVAVYPSSTPGRASPVLQIFLELAASFYHGYFREDLLLRAKPAPRHEYAEGAGCEGSGSFHDPGKHHARQRSLSKPRGG